MLSEYIIIYIYNHPTSCFVFHWVLPRFILYNVVIVWPYISVIFSFMLGISLALLKLDSPTGIFIRSHVVFWIQNQTPITTKEEKLAGCGEFIALDSVASSVIKTLDPSELHISAWLWSWCQQIYFSLAKRRRLERKATMGSEAGIFSN